MSHETSIPSKLKAFACASPSEKREKIMRHVERPGNAVRAAFKHSAHLSPLRRLEFLIRLCALHFTAKTLALPPRIQVPIVLPKELFNISYRFFCETDQGRGEIGYFLSLIEAHDVVLDIGGFCGAYSFASKAVGGKDVEVYCIEPLDCNFRRIRTVQALNGHLQIHAIQSLVSDGGLENVRIVEADSMIRLGDSSGTISALPVRSASVDNICEQRRIHPTIIKIDVDGFEFHVLRSAKRVLTEDRPTLFIELHAQYLSDQGVFIPEIVAYLSSFGYVEAPFTDVDSPMSHIAYHSLFVHREKQM